MASRKEKMASLLAQSNKDPFKTTNEAKEEERNKAAIRQALYGAGGNGWTEQWYNKILKAYNNNTLSYGPIPPGVIPQKGTKAYEKYSNANLILAQNKQEKDLTDDERLLLFMLCRPSYHQKSNIDDFKFINGKWQRVVNEDELTKSDELEEFRF